MGIVTWESAGRLRVCNPVTVLFTDLDTLFSGENMPAPSDCPTEAGEKCIFPFKSGKELFFSPLKQNSSPRLHHTR